MTDQPAMLPASEWMKYLRGESDEATEMMTLAVAIADQGSRFDIEFACTAVVLATGEWLDTSTLSPDVSGMANDARDRWTHQVQRALRYLELRGHLLRNPSYPQLVRFADDTPPH